MSDLAISIRPMRTGDADAVRHLDAQAFARYARERGGQDAVSLRTRENIVECLALNPGGCFVAEAAELCGHVFSRRWGRWGWIGVFGVHPDRHGHGIGKRLLGRAVASLDAAACSIIGLETMPDSAYNVGLYARSGFRPANVTLVLERPVTGLGASGAFALLSRLDEGPGLTAVTAVSDAAYPGLDYSVEAHNAREFGWGDTILAGWPEPWAVAIVRTRAKREGSSGGPAEVTALAVADYARSRLLEAVGAVESFACERGLLQVRISANAADWETLRALLVHGYRVSYLTLRLLYRGDYARPHGVELSRWAM